MIIDLKNEKLSDDVFYRLQKEVLQQWVTGKDVNFEEAVAYQKAIPAQKRFSAKLDKAVEDKITLIQPRAGVALYEEHIELLKYLEDVGGADLLPSTIDSYTRHNRYQEAQVGIDDSVKMKRSLLNGFPAVNHGVQVCRKVTSSVKSPVQVRRHQALCHNLLHFVAQLPVVFWDKLLRLYH